MCLRWLDVLTEVAVLLGVVAAVDHLDHPLAEDLHTAGSPDHIVQLSSHRLYSTVITSRSLLLHDLFLWYHSYTDVRYNVLVCKLYKNKQ